MFGFFSPWTDQAKTVLSLQLLAELLISVLREVPPWSHPDLIPGLPSDEFLCWSLILSSPGNVILSGSLNLKWKTLPQNALSNCSAISYLSLFQHLQDTGVACTRSTRTCLHRLCQWQPPCWHQWYLHHSPCGRRGGKSQTWICTWINAEEIARNFFLRGWEGALPVSVHPLLFV